MKKDKLFFIVLFSVFASIFSCEDTRLDNISTPSVYFPQSGEIEQIIYDTGEPYIYRLGIYKSGVEEVSTTATVDFMSDAELQAYNTKYNEDFKKIPESCFQFKEGKTPVVTFSNKSRLEFAEIEIFYDEIEKLPDYDSENTEKYVIPLVLSHADIAITENKQITLINVLIREASIYLSSLETAIKIESSEKEYIQTLELSVDFTNLWDISVDIEVDEDALEEYNMINGTDLKILPSAAYTLSPNSLIINKGEKTAKFTVSLNVDNIDYDDFLLPITISNTSKFVVDEERKTHYFFVSRPALRLDRDGWTIVDVSSEEVSGEGAGQGVATCILDGNTSTYWHSQWAGGTGQLPHHITIDLQKEVTIAGIDLQRRNNNSDTYKGNFLVSSDNQSFTKVGTFEMGLINDPQTFKVSTTKGRYFKLEITESRRSPFANLAEVYIRGVEE